MAQICDRRSNKGGVSLVRFGSVGADRVVGQQVERLESAVRIGDAVAYRFLGFGGTRNFG